MLCLHELCFNDEAIYVWLLNLLFFIYSLNNGLKKLKTNQIPELGLTN